jgi:acetyl esterase/lipase
VWLNGRGIAAFVLDYRLGSNGYRHPAMLLDIMRAIRMVRSHAAEWQIDPARVGVMGSSAGGHLASTALTHFDDGQPAAGDPVERAGSRPDFGVLCYPVISMGGVTHGGSRQNLLGDNPPADLVELLSSDLQVTRDTPPCFIWHTADDAVVDVRNSLDFAAALSKNGVPFELHVYPHGAHGLGLGVHGYDPAGAEAPELLRWTRELAVWLRESGIGR